MKDVMRKSFTLRCAALTTKTKSSWIKLFTVYSQKKLRE